MADKPSDYAMDATTVNVDPGLVSYTNWVYALHALSILIGICSAAAVVTMFIFGVPSIVAVIMNYARRSDVRGTWLESHFRWQIRTFWFALLWVVASTLLFGPFVLILIGLPFLIVSYVLIGLWVTYRIARGWLALRSGRALPGSPQPVIP
jgi:uncharacterized membrane protein